MATDFMAQFGFIIHLAEWRLKTACNIAVPIQNVQWQYISYILCRYDENRSSNSRDYKVTNGPFWRRQKSAYLTE